MSIWETSLGFDYAERITLALESISESLDKITESNDNDVEWFKGLVENLMKEK